ncbi:MAG: adenylate/guanylate cyclase domain-containing protein [Gemmatimonadota bacterium]|nr:adenylate/guanylate cyclase domain-containing protein [Gemmatimonadota bacterium]
MVRRARRRVALASIVVGAALVSWWAGRTGGLTGVDALESMTLDWRQTTTAESFVPEAGSRESEIVLVLFDEYSVMDSLDGWPYLSPFPRAHLAEIVEALSSAGARTIGLDVYLDRRYPALDALDGGDGLLRDAISRAGNVILVAPVARTDSGPVLDAPHPFFAEAAAGVGAADFPAPFETVRDGTLAVRSGSGLAPSFALALFAAHRGTMVDSLLLLSRAAGRVTLPGLPSGLGGIPESWWEEGTAASSALVHFPLLYHGPPSRPEASAPPGTFQAFASSSVTATARLFPAFFADRLVLVGTGFHDEDRFRTPFFSARPTAAPGERDPDPYGYMYGVEVHANALQTMLDGTYVRPLGGMAVGLLLLLVALFAGGTVFLKGAWWGGGATLLAVAGVFVAAFWSWAGHVYGPWGSGWSLEGAYLWLPVVTPTLAAMLSYTGAAAYVSVVEGRDKRFIRSAFAKYVSPEVVAGIAEHPETLQLGGEKRVLTLLFADLVGFTTLAEHMDPQDLVARLNVYLSEMTGIVLAQRGTLDKYIGDAIMAFWNAPEPLEDHADRAVRAAVLMQREITELNARWLAEHPDAPELSMRIGVNSGTAVVGNLGGVDHFDYSAVGDAVNLAARLEPTNKAYGTSTLVSESTLARTTEGAFRTREVDLVTVKGREQPVRIFELLEEAGVSLSPAREAAVAAFTAGLEAYRRREWDQAAALFRRVLDSDPDDGPGKVYLDRALAFAAAPPPEDWDFVVRRTEK